MRDAFTVQRLGPGDLPLFRAMNRLFGDAFDERETYGEAPPDDDYVEDWLAKDHVIALVALSDGMLAGALVAYELDKFERARREVYIYDLAVAEPHRRRGVATALIARLGGIAGRRSAWVMYVQADLGDDPAIALYDKLGEREAVLHFDLPVR